MQNRPAPPRAWDYDWQPNPWGFGSASAIDHFSAPRDVVAELHAVVEEITGKPAVKPRARIGFLP